MSSFSSSPVPWCLLLCRCLGVFFFPRALAAFEFCHVVCFFFVGFKILRKLFESRQGLWFRNVFPCFFRIFFPYTNPTIDVGFETSPSSPSTFTQQHQVFQSPPVLLCSPFPPRLRSFHRCFSRGSLWRRSQAKDHCRMRRGCAFFGCNVLQSYRLYVTRLHRNLFKHI